MCCQHQKTAPLSACLASVSATRTLLHKFADAPPKTMKDRGTSRAASGKGPASGAERMLSALVWQVGVAGVSVYDVLWGAVFGFATLNILGLRPCRFEPGRTRMTLGEFLPITLA